MTMALNDRYSAWALCGRIDFRASADAKANSVSLLENLLSKPCRAATLCPSSVSGVSFRNSITARQRLFSASGINPLRLTNPALLTQFRARPAQQRFTIPLGRGTKRPEIGYLGNTHS